MINHLYLKRKINQMYDEVTVMKTNEFSQPYLLLLDIINPAIIQFNKTTREAYNLVEGLEVVRLMV